VGSDAAVDGARAAKNVAATVLEELPQAIFAVRLDSEQRVLAHLAGMVERNFVRLVPGDRVEVALAPNDPGRGKILRKLN
jgi:translation initiation factor IF-1